MTPDGSVRDVSLGDVRTHNRSLFVRIAAVLLANGQTSEGTRLALVRLGRAFGREVRFAPAWGASTIDDGRSAEPCFAEPAGVDIGRVIATEALVDDVCHHRVSASEALTSLETIERRPPVSLARFATMAGAGAAALAAIFGAPNLLTLVWIAGVAGAGACLRRAMSHLSGNPFLQPFMAAALAGAGGGAATFLGLDVSHRLVAVCPCMVLVPGPHFLNGTIDLARARIPIGAARLALATLIVIAICAGLLSGLALTGTPFPSNGPTRPVPLVYDVVAAGIAVAAYGSFFNMPWRMLPIPIGIGMIAHALRWESLAMGASLQLGAFGACLLVGAVITPVAHKSRMPFGACAFASVVSLIPGVFMFQAASDAIAMVDLGVNASQAALVGLVSDSATAGFILLAMTAGLIIPKIMIDTLLRRFEKK